ncbi:MAG: DUF2007 domain-containing protein [Bacteroidetes bacterium]|jgi:hypothetical protein|nr:DUF2007 domain-containing protein [Bacteroidota bacterium]
MFCPQCKTEYRPGFTRCADCGVDLVDRLPEEPVEEVERITGSSQLVQVLRTKDRSDVLSIQMVLDSAGIEYLLQGELMTSFRDPVVLLVREEDFERVRELLKDIHLNYSSSAFNPKKGR